jgi:hypothetical protein
LRAQPAIVPKTNPELRYGETTTRARAARVRNANSTTFRPIRKKGRKQNGKQTAQKMTFAQTRQASLTRRRIYTPEFLAYARQRFEQTGDSLVDIGLDLGISSESVRLLGKREDWKRYAPPPQGLPPAVKLVVQAETPDHQPREQSGPQGAAAAVLPQAEGEGDIPPLADTVARLHRAVIDELAAIDALPAHTRNAGSSARTARTLASLTETLQKLQRMEPDPANAGPDDADMPADIDEFRNELARRIEVFVAERADAGDAGGAVAPSLDAAPQ